MSAEVKKEIQLEIAHVLFIDIVGYSKLSINEQRAAVDELTQIVRGTEQFQKADASERLIKIATGDGMALVFYTSPEAPVRCAVELSRALKDHPQLRLRMGIHSGPVSGVIDVTGRTNLAGAGLNMARRVMECGDGGHILLSKHVAEDLEEYDEWRPRLHELGSCEVKHGVRVSVVNLYSDQFGNATLPRKFETIQKRRTRVRWTAAIAALLALATIIAGIAMFSRYRMRSMLPAIEKTIAVLPFENLSEDKANAYFADGIQEEILTRLAGIADLKVISRTSTRQYQSRPRNLAEIAKQLGVANILEGSVQKAADQVRVNVQLVNARTDSHLWAATYDRKLNDIFGVESEIAKGITESLQAKLSGREEQALAVKPTNNPEAYDAYLRGLAFETRYYNSGFATDLEKKAISFFERAVELDPNFAVAWARLSRANADLYWFQVEPTPAVWRDKAQRALDNAQKLEPNSPETLLALGYYQFWVLAGPSSVPGDYEAAKGTFRRVGKVLPNSSEVPNALALIARREGHWEESIAYFEQALAMDPRNVEVLTNAGTTYNWHRQYPAALKLWDRVLDIRTNDPDAMEAKALTYQTEGNLQEAARYLPEINSQASRNDAQIWQLRLERNYGEAIRLLQAELAEFHYATQEDKGSDQVGLAFIQRIAGDTAGAKATAEQARNTFERLLREQPDSWFYTASLSNAYALMGEKDLALKLAERAIVILPRAKSAVRGPAMEENLALIQTMFGENGPAISTLSQLLQTPYESWVWVSPIVITPALLRLDPIWDPLRTDPAFQKLCEEKQP
jgi:TolB-like protein/class 3 adenylate cyclase/predicted Zn-dependent protease